MFRINIAIGLIAGGLLIGAMVGCTKNTSHYRPSGAIHPQRVNIPHKNDIAHAVGADSLIKPPERFTAYLERFEDTKMLYSLGVKEGARWEMIGKAEDIAAINDELIYVLDSRYNEVKVYNATGHYVKTIAGPGQGPKELMAPHSMLVTNEKLLYIGDRGYRIKIFKIHDNSFSALDPIILKAPANDMCIIDDKLFIQHFNESGNTVHSYTLPGEHINSFAPSYQSSNWIVRMNYSSGSIICDETNNTIVITYDILPIIYGYSPNGDFKWASEIQNFRPVAVEELVSAGGRLAAKVNSTGTTDRILSLVSTPGGMVIIQVGRMVKLEGQETRRSVTTYMLDSGTGKGMALKGGLFKNDAGGILPIVSFISDKTIYMAAELPFPKVSAFAY